MKAVLIEQPGDEEVLQIGDTTSPTPGTGELRIKVAAAGINRADLLQRRGLYPPPPGASPIIGLECSGTVIEVGPGVSGRSTGERVMALLAGGGYAEEVVVPAGCAMAVPPALSDEQAGGTPEVFLTAFLNLFMLGGLQAGQRALIHGGSGGVGTAAIQLVRAAGAEAIVTAGSDERCRRCLELGAGTAINYRTESLGKRVLEVTGGAGVEVVLDCVAAPYLADHLRVLARGGRLVVIGLMGGARAELDLARLLTHHLHIIGSTLRSRSARDKAEIITAFRERFGPALSSGEIKPVIDRVLPLGEVATAHRLLAAGEVFGKIVLTT
jgi:putative PIG3 family NAD(P)H quinone oxidoreductase